MNLLLEIGCEELPAKAISIATEFLPQKLGEELKSLRLNFGTIEAFGTPRRISLWAQDLEASQKDLITEILGPKVEIAFDDKNQLTATGLGFLKARHIDPQQAYAKNGVLAARVHQKGRSSLDILSEILPKIILQIPFSKTMRWESSNTRFARPIRWILCLLDQKIVPFEIAGVKSSDKTCGHRFMAPSFKRVTQKTYFDFLSKNFVIIDTQKRKELISKQTPTPDPDLLNLVANLVEYPWPILGSFDKNYLKIPQEILICEMREHQKYFPILDTRKKLKSDFLIVSGSKPARKTQLAAGNTRVLKARFEDGAFYYQEDLKKKLADYLAEPPHELIQWAEKLASYLEFQDKKLLERSAYLCKADLNTGVVGQFPELQGIMGSIYAHKDGENQEVVQAIREHYWPRFSGDKIPSTKLGAILSLADRLQILHRRKLPKGNADPYGLRRAAIGLTRIILEHDFNIHLQDLIHNVEILEFVLARSKGVFLEDHPVLIIEATASAAGSDLCAWKKRIEALSNFDYGTVSAVFKRVSHIVLKNNSNPIGKIINLGEPSELALFKAINAIEISDNFPKMLQQLEKLKPLLDQFFENIMVMTEDRELRQSRLNLLTQVQHKATYVADFSKLT